MLKRLLRHPATLALAARLIGLYLAFTYATTRWTLLGARDVAWVAEPGLPLVASFWHERLPMMPMLWRLARRKFPSLAAHRAHVLVSRHRDGRAIGDVVSRFRLETVHGSTSRGGTAGVIALLRLLEGGDMVAITPDGPRGPRRVAAAGVAQIAALAGVPVVPCAAATSRRIVLRSWDRMVLPLPFSRGVVVVRPTVSVSRDEAGTALQAIAAGMNEACAIADAWVAGQPVPELDRWPG
ncbi:lysophospholipid acyltransferase family protein [Roseomonas sp. BN140053]|uniref:lysophospholipid acyltransferase family protein n=1 Tax=Roseomonas sp. BN140053 TaxID=3391898 RepID=UPI0039EBE7E1